MARIAIVEDDENVRNTIAKVLTRAGYEVEYFASVEQALAACDWQCVDLLMTDLVMEAKGEDLIQFIQRDYPEMPIVVITGVIGERLENLSALNISCVLKKPFHPRELVHAVQEWIPG